MRSAYTSGETMAENKEMNVTYETLFELLRRERGREELQELTESFFSDVAQYLQSKQEIMQSQKGQLFTEDDRKKTSVQLENAKKLLRELFEKRDRKIIMMALTRSRTGTDIVDTTKMLEQERTLYQESITLLASHRKTIWQNIESGKAAPLKVEEPAKETMLIRFLQPVPKFIGRELEPYGPFQKEEIASLPSAIARILIDKQRAETISDS
jgi:DNA replication initiation complex subunit (GINS family)